MTTNEAINILENGKYGIKYADEEWVNSVDLAITALKKQVPMKIRQTTFTIDRIDGPETDTIRSCPICNYNLWSIFGPFCPNCGQRIANKEEVK